MMICGTPKPWSDHGTPEYIKIKEDATNQKNKDIIDNLRSSNDSTPVEPPSATQFFENFA